MDYVYESAGGKLSDSQETLQPSSSNKNVDEKTAEINRKTEQSFEKLESEISKTYTAIESRASTWGSSFSSWVNTNLQVADVISEAKKQVENLHLDQKFNDTKTAITKNIDSIQKKVINEENAANSKNMLALLSSKTNTYLDSLDKDLEQVESAAGKYATRFGEFLKETISVRAPDDDDDDLIDDDVANLLFNVKDHKTGLKVSASRTEAQLHTLHTSPELYLTTQADPNFDTFMTTFKADEKTDEITALLKDTPSLQELSTQLVPAKVNYNEFWARYFYMKDKILEQESTRKKLLGRAQEAIPSTTDDLSWGDDDEEDDEGKESGKETGKLSAASSDGTYELNSVASSILEVDKKKGTKETEEDENEDEDEDDDDWE